MTDAARRARLVADLRHMLANYLPPPGIVPTAVVKLETLAALVELAAENSRLAAELEDAQEALHEKRSRAPVWDELDRIAGELNNIHNSELERLRTESARLAARVAELIDECALLRRERNVAGAAGAAWIWSDTDANDIESMSDDLVVTMRAGQLRELLRAALASEGKP